MNDSREQLELNTLQELWCSLASEWAEITTNTGGYSVTMSHAKNIAQHATECLKQANSDHFIQVLSWMKNESVFIQHEILNAILADQHQDLKNFELWCSSVTDRIYQMMKMLSISTSHGYYDDYVNRDAWDYSWQFHAEYCGLKKG